MRNIKRLSVVLVFAFVLLTLTGCFTTNTVLDAHNVEPPVKIEEPEKYKLAGSMEKTYDIKYTLFTRLQKPSDEELLEKIVKATQKKYGKDALIDNIVFTRILKDKTDMLALIPGSNVNFSDMKYKIKATWNVYVLNE